MARRKKNFYTEDYPLFLKSLKNSLTGKDITKIARETGYTARYIREILSIFQKRNDIIISAAISCIEDKFSVFREQALAYNKEKVILELDKVAEAGSNE